MRQISLSRIITVLTITLFLVAATSPAVALQLTLKPGQTAMLDAADLNNPQEFYFQVESDLGEFLEMEIQNDNGFECEITSQYLVSRRERVSWPTTLTYQFTVAWAPGADLSGCKIKIWHLDYPNKKATLNIKMAY